LEQVEEPDLRHLIINFHHGWQLEKGKGRVKHKKILILLISIIGVTEAIGTVSNRVVMSLNRGMPAMGLAVAFGKWVPENQGTRLPLLTDVIRAGDYAISVGDLFIFAGMVTSMIAIWIALPQGRKLFPFLIASMIGIFWSLTLPNNMISTLLFMTAGVSTILGMYWKYRASNKNVKAVAEEEPVNFPNDSVI
jgi:hypothetical protein